MRYEIPTAAAAATNRAVRYLRLFVVAPEQEPGSGATRIYELEVY